MPSFGLSSHTRWRPSSPVRLHFEPLVGVHADQTIVGIAVLSDRLRVRGIIMLFTIPLAIIGYAVIANVDSNSVKYGMTFLMATGLYATVPCILGWISNNSAGHYMRATTTGMQLAIANCGGFVAAFIYPKAQGPMYHEGHTVICGLLCFAWLM